MSADLPNRPIRMTHMKSPRCMNTEGTTTRESSP